MQQCDLSEDTKTFEKRCVYENTVIQSVFEASIDAATLDSDLLL